MYWLLWLVIRTMGTIDLCDITALFGVFGETNKHQISRDLGPLFWRGTSDVSCLLGKSSAWFQWEVQRLTSKGPGGQPSMSMVLTHMLLSSPWPWQVLIGPTSSRWPSEVLTHFLQSTYQHSSPLEGAAHLSALTQPFVLDNGKT